MNIAAIFAGGIGSRMGSSVPKQFLEIYGKPIIVHTLEKFQYNNKIDLIYVGCKKEYISLLESLVEKYNLNKIKVGCILEGGKSGLETIYKILEKIYSEHNVVKTQSIKEIFDIDKEVRIKTKELIQRSYQCLNI